MASLRRGQEKGPVVDYKIKEAFDAALVAAIDYGNGIVADKDREIATLKARVETLESEITRLRALFRQPKATV